MVCERESPDEIQDYEYPDDDEAGDDDTMPCPHCDEPVYDDAEQCPSCGRYLSRESPPTRPPPLWIIVGVTLCVLVLMAWIFGL